jgi:hypothetical protein
MNAHRSRVATLLLGLFLSVIAVSTRAQGADDVTALDAQPPALRSYLAALAPANLATALAWQIETVDNSGSVGLYTSLALDSAGHPHIGYYDDGNGDLSYATYDGATWHNQLVYGASDSGSHVSLALDASDHPHFVFLRSWSPVANYLKYASYDGSTWHFQDVEVGGPLDAYLYTSLALDSTGRPHVSYYSFGSADLVYARLDTGGWYTSTVDAVGDVGKYTSLALDSNDRPHIAYFNETGDDLKYAYHSGRGWQVMTLDNNDILGQHTSLALDSNDRPHISYYGTYPFQGLKYAHFDGSAWHRVPIDGTADVGTYTSLALDGKDRPHISYYDEDNQDLKLAYFDGTLWHTEVVDDGGMVGSYTSLALDGAGQPHISYYDETRSALKYATDVPVIYRRWAAQLIEDARGTDMAPGWELAQLSSGVRSLYRPDVDGVAYYEFPVVVPATAVQSADAYDPAGYVLVSTGDHDAMIPHWSFSGQPPGMQLQLIAQEEGLEVAKTYQLDAWSYAAEDASGVLIAELGEPLVKLSGLDPAWLDDPPAATETTWMPDRQLVDDTDAATISGTLAISGPVNPPTFQVGAWASWSELKSGYADSHGVLLEALHRAASEEWTFRSQITREGIELQKGDTHIMALLWTTPTLALSGEGSGYVKSELVNRTGLPPALHITVLDSVPGKELPLTLDIHYPNGVAETMLFSIVEPHRVWLPLVGSFFGGGAGSVWVQGVEEAQDHYGPWHRFWTGSPGEHHNEQRIYDQIAEGTPPNDSSCQSGCGATAWAMLFGWADYQASIGNPYWEGRWGLYRYDGGTGADAVAPRSMTSGVNNMTWEIRDDVKTSCVSWAGTDPGYTTMWDMKNARFYVAQRSCTRVETYWGIGVSASRRDKAIASIRERNTPAIILSNSLDHYPLAYGYRYRCWWSAGNCLWRDREFYLNQGWGDVTKNKWVNGLQTHFVGLIYPCSRCGDDVAVSRLASDGIWHKLVFDYDHNGVTDGELYPVGFTGDRYLIGDFDRDGHVDDVATFRSSARVWYYDYNADGVTDLVVHLWGEPNDFPYAGDFDRDGFVDDVAVYRPTEFTWYFDHGHDGTTDATIGVGCGSCWAVVGDFDRDGFVDDVGFFRFIEREWLYIYDFDSGKGEIVGPWGTTTDLPVAGDFDCDGHTDDVAVFRPSTRMWYYDYNHDGDTDETVGPWGTANDLPVPLAGGFGED